MSVIGPDGCPAVDDRPEPDAAELAKVRALAEQLHEGKDFDRQVFIFRREFPLDWIRRALEDTAAWTTPPRTFQPILNRLRAWDRAGGPPPETVDSHVRPPARRRPDDYEPSYFRYFTPEETGRAPMAGSAR